MRCRSRVSDERGSATAELAIALPAVVLVLGCCLSGMRIVAQQLRLQDAVAAVTRAEARNDDGDALASRLAPDATLTSWNDGELVCARLSARAYGAAAALMPLELSATSCAHGGGM